MSSIYNYLLSVVEPGDYWLTYQQIDSIITVYVNVKPVQHDGYSIIEQIRVSTNMKFKFPINLIVNKMYYSCACQHKCKLCIPPRFIGEYDIYDRNHILAGVTTSQYYQLSPLARFNHFYIDHLTDLKKDYNVICWVRWSARVIEIIDSDYVDGIPIYDIETVQKLLYPAEDATELIISVPSLDISPTMLEIINIFKNLNIKNKHIKIQL